MSLLSVDMINVYYGDVHILRDVSISIEQNTIVSILGGNGAGKTTLMKTLSGLLYPRSGSIHFDEHDIKGLPPHEIAKLGVAQVMEGRRLFPHMTVKENLLMGAYNLNDPNRVNLNFDKVFELFPILRERSAQLARSFSGGEQQMLAIGRGLMASPKLLILDEPSLGIAPVAVNTIFEVLKNIKEEGITILLVEQDAKKSLTLASYGYVIENGKVVMQDESQKLLANAHLKKAYLGA